MKRLEVESQVCSTDVILDGANRSVSPTPSKPLAATTVLQNLDINKHRSSKHTNGKLTVGGGSSLGMRSCCSGESIPEHPTAAMYSESVVTAVDEDTDSLVSFSQPNADSIGFDGDTALINDYLSGLEIERANCTDCNSRSCPPEHPVLCKGSLGLSEGPPGTGTREKHAQLSPQVADQSQQTDVSFTQAQEEIDAAREEVQQRLESSTALISSLSEERTALEADRTAARNEVAVASRRQAEMDSIKVALHKRESDIARRESELEKRETLLQQSGDKGKNQSERCCERDVKQRLEECKTRETALLKRETTLKSREERIIAASEAVTQRERAVETREDAVKQAARARETELCNKERAIKELQNAAELQRKASFDAYRERETELETNMREYEARLAELREREERVNSLGAEIAEREAILIERENSILLLQTLQRVNSSPEAQPVMLKTSAAPLRRSSVYNALEREPAEKKRGFISALFCY